LSRRRIGAASDSKRRLVEQKMQDMIQTAKMLSITKEELNAMMDILYEEI
jgi:GntR family transcriptional regulator